MEIPSLVTHHGFLLAGALLLGTILQALRYVRSFKDLKVLFGCIGIALLGLLPGKHERDYRFDEHLIIVAGWFTLAIAFVFRKRIIGTLTEQYLLHVNIIYAYFLLTHFSWYQASDLLLVALFPSIHTLILICLKQPFKTGINILSFLWFFLMNIVMLIGSFVHFFVILIQSGSTGISLWEALTLGPAFFLLIAYSFYIWSLVPIPGKHQSFKQRLVQVKQFIRELDRAYDNVQLRRRHACLIILIEGGLLWMNWIFKFTSATIAINVSLILFSILIPSTKKPPRIEL